MIQLKDIISMDDIIANNSKCVTSLFSGLADTYNAELIKLLKTNNSSVTIEYLGNRLDKMLSPLYRRILETDALNVNAKLYGIITNKYLDKWNRLANALFSDYNPIENYNMTESSSGGKNIKVNTDMNTEEHETNSYSGFDSDDFKNTTKSDKSGSTTGTKAKNEQAETENRSLRRSGNIGVTTSQQMIESEIKLREHNLLDIIYDDIDSILFLDYYC